MLDERLIAVCEGTSVTRERTVRASELLKDIQSGLNDSQIMAKYAITAKQLEYLFHRMVEARVISKQQLEQRTYLAETRITRAFVEVQRSIEELDDNGEADPDRVYRDALRDLASENDSPISTPLQTKQPPRKIRASDLVKDITSGMNDPDLLAKYRLQPSQLEFMLQRLVEAGKITETQLVERTHITSTSITKAFVDVYQSLRELDEGDWDV